MGRYFQKPLVLTGRGTDTHLIPRYRLPRKMIQWAAANMSGIVTVCTPLKEERVDLALNCMPRYWGKRGTAARYARGGFCHQRTVLPELWWRRFVRNGSGLT